MPPSEKPRIRSGASGSVEDERGRPPGILGRRRVPVMSAEGDVRMARDERISAVIACYHDEQAIPIMYDRLTATFERLGVDYEIIFVNDGSPDASGQVLRDLAARDRPRCCRRRRWAGFLHATATRFPTVSYPAVR